MYLMVGRRPDLSFSIGALSRFVISHVKEHLAEMKRVLRYVKGSVYEVYMFDKIAPIKL